MKVSRTLLLALCLACAAAGAPLHAQSAGRATLSAEDLRERTHVTLGGEWKFHPGDDPAWSDPAYDDASWTVVEARGERFAFDRSRIVPPSQGGPPIGWFRLHLELDPALRGEQIGVMLSRFAPGAAALYLDGELLFDGWPDDPSRSALRPVSPRLLRLDGPHHVLAVRYSLAGAEETARRGGMRWPGLHVDVMHAERGQEGWVEPVALHMGVAMFFLGLLLTFAVLHLVLFLFFTRPVANLFFALFALASAFHVWVLHRQLVATTVAETLHWQSVIQLVNIPLTYLMAGLFTYSLFYRRLPWHGWLYSGIALLAAVLFLLNPRVQSVAYGWMSLAMAVIAVGVVLSALWRRKEGAVVLGLGMLALVGNVVYQEILPELGVIARPALPFGVWYGLVPLMLAMSIHLARSHARTSRGFERLSLELQEANRTLEQKVEQRTAELAASESKYRGLIETANDAILLIAVEALRIVDANPAAERLLGRTREQLLGMRFPGLCPAEEYDRYQELLREHIRRGTPIGEDLYLLHADGTRIPVEISASLTEVEGMRVIQGIIHDITERKQAEAVLAEAKELAEAANQAKSQFLANMSHELRTPLNAIIGYSEMLQEEAQELGQEELTPDLGKIHAAGRHLLGLINDILDLSKVEAGRMELFLEHFSPEAMLREVASTVRPLVEKNRNALVTRADGVGQMRADQTKLRQILFNLLSNAAKFTENGTITLTAEREAGGAGGDRIVFQVSDTGIGMTPEQLERLFQPFMQADASTTRRYGGTGLGLTITRRFCEMLGGSIQAESEVGIGTTFTVDLPADVADTPLPRAPAETVSAGEDAPRVASEAAGHPERPLILVVDDEASAREVMERILVREGFRVLTAATGEEALRLARERRPEVITLDVMMPGMDGWAVLGTFKADPELCEIPVVMVSILDERQLGYALGAADYLVKPVSRQRLAQVLRKHLEAATGAAPVLIVEDDPVTREMLRRSLEREGWPVVEAENGRGGLERIEQQVPALILLDLMMPEMDGFEFLDALRARRSGRQIPVVVLTAKELTEAERQRLRGHVERVLQKGAIPREQVVEELRRLLAGAAQLPL